MSEELINIYKQKIEKIKNDKNTIAIFLVGSSKSNINEYKIDKIKDIDLFIIYNQIEDQTRLNKKIKNLEFDINKFSEKYVYKLIKDKTYFFINEMRDAKTLYDKKNIANEVIYLSKIAYEDGPKLLSKEEITIMKNIIFDNISRLKEKNTFEDFEYEFLTNVYLKDIIKGYFILNCKWIPKDKKLFNYLKENEKNLFKLIKKFYKDYNYNTLKEIYNYIFESV